MCKRALIALMCANTLQHTATHCNTLQHTATHCNTLQHTVTHCNTLQHTAALHIGKRALYICKRALIARICANTQRSMYAWAASLNLRPARARRPTPPEIDSNVCDMTHSYV